MLNFTTTTFINSEDSFWTVKADDTATKKYAAGTASNKVELKDKAKQTKLVVSGCPELYSDDLHTVCHVYKNKASLARPAKATVTLPTAATTIGTATIGTGIFRISLYIRISNNNSSVYANDWVFKGKPLYFEFKAGDTAADVIKTAKKHMLTTYGKELLKLSGTGNSLVIEAKDQWQIFLNQEGEKSVRLEELQKTDSLLNPEKFVDITTTTNVTINSPGVEAFGDFAHVTKDLRLPTGANNRWYGIAAGDIMNGEPNDDKPNPGCQYTQYTVVYESERGVQQGDALGGLARSRTTHVFYVVDTAVDPDETTGEVVETAGSDVAKSFEKALEVLGVKKATETPAAGEIKIELAGYTTTA